MSMPKSGKNICKRKDGWWEGRYAKGQFDGKNQCDYGFGCTYENDERKLNGVLDQFLNLPTFSSDTFEYLSKEWLAVKTPQLKISSVAKYTNILNLYLNPKFSKRHVSSILRSDVVMFCRELLVSGGVKSNGLAPKTVNSIISLMKNILDYASKEKGITVADLNDISVKQPQKPMRILSRGEQQKLSQYLCMHLTPCNLGILLCLYTGLRLGEICALKWNDVYISEQYIHIHQTMQRVQIQNDSASKTEVIIQSPKSDCSVRKIPIPSEILKLLLLFQQKNNAFLLTGMEDRFVEPRSMENCFKAVAKECDIKDVHFHTLRHTFATRCVEIGFDIKSLSEILGHASVNITLNCYVHPSMELKQKNMNMLSDFLITK